MICWAYSGVLYSLRLNFVLNSLSQSRADGAWITQASQFARVCVYPVDWTCVFSPQCIHQSQPQLQNECSVPTLTHTCYAVNILLFLFGSTCPLRSWSWSWSIFCPEYFSVFPASNASISTQGRLWLVETGVFRAAKMQNLKNRGFFKSYCKSIQSSDWSPW